MRKTLNSLAILGALLAPTVALAQLRITAGYVTASEFLPLFIGAEKGMFARRGLAVEPRRISLITNIPPALLSGDLQIGVTTVPVLLQANDGGLDILLIAGAARHLKTNARIALMVRSDLKLEKPSDLIGKKIGVAGINSTMDVFLRKWLKMKGVDEKQVTRIETNFPQMSDLMKNGTIDAATMTEPLRSLALKNGVAYVFNEYASEVNPDVLMIAYMATSDWARKNPQAVKDFRAGLDEAGEWAKANPGEIRAIEQKYLGVSSDAPNNFTTAMNAADIDFYITLGKEFGLYKTALDPRKLIVE